MRLAVCALAMLPAYAAVDGTIMNGTSGKAQPGVIVSLVQPGQGGMQALGTTKSDGNGKFHFDQQGRGGGPQLLQAIFGGVTYTKMIPPGMPAADIQVEIYEPTLKAGVAQVAQDLILLQPSDTQLAVNESFFFQNASKTTFNDSKNGTLHFYLPPEANGVATVSVTSPGGMPVARTASKTAQKDVYSVDYPVRPGETRFDVNYTIPASKPMVFSGKVLHAEGATRMAAPAGVTLQSDDLTSLGQEPQTKASIYEVKGKSYKIEIQGTGAMSGGEGGAPADDDSGAPKIEEIRPRVYDKIGWILGFALSILGLGLFLLYRSSQTAPVETAQKPPSTPARKGAVSR